jgi:gas vesicle protein
MREMNRNENKEQTSTKDFLIGAILGGVVGAATALLLTPKSGQALRNDFNEQVDSLKNKTNHLKVIASKRGNELIAATKEKTVQIKTITIDKGTSISRVNER